MTASNAAKKDLPVRGAGANGNGNSNGNGASTGPASASDGAAAGEAKGDGDGNGNGNGNGSTVRPGGVVLVTDQLQKPSLDDRSYRVIRLPNELEVLLVHDPEADKASASMDVNTGSFSDEPDMPGMAHAVEHLLFLGTKSFPTENDYNQYLAAHSGSSNAYTGQTSTNYYFEVGAKSAPDAPATTTDDTTNDRPSDADNPSPLRGALDRFSKFFIEPLFQESSLERELQAVDSEHKKNLQDDLWRYHQLNRSLANPSHPFSYFTIGNFEVLKTLPEARGITVRDKFIEFHTTHYSANRMKLVILGREPLDLLEAWAAEFFSDVPNKHLAQNRWPDELPFRQSDLATRVCMKPVMDTRSLTLQFPIPEETDLYETQPSRYLSHLIGHEGPGSIMAYTKARGWVLGLSIGMRPVSPGSPSLLDCGIRLTEEGLKNYDRVLAVFFEYAALLRDRPAEEWIFQEQKVLSEVDFRFREKTAPSQFTSRISSRMQQPVPREWLLSGSCLRRFDPDLIRACLECVTPDNVRISILSQTYPGDWDQREKWYGTEYRYDRIPADMMADLRAAAARPAAGRIADLHLPHPNSFIPTKLEVEKRLVRAPALGPVLIRDDATARTWWKRDDTFWVPRANVLAWFRNRLVGASAENSVMARFFAELVRDALEEYSYDAELAGLNYGIMVGADGLVLDLGGYNDKLAVLLEKVLATMRDLDIREDRFDIIKDRIRRSYHNEQLQSAFTLVGDYTSWLDEEHDLLTEDLAAALPAVTVEATRHFRRQLLGQFHTEVYVMGNLGRADGLALTAMIEATLRPRVLAATQWPSSRSLLPGPGANFVYERPTRDPDNVNHAIEYVLHVGDRADRLVRAKTLLLDQMLREPTFDQLRTKEQLGYVVMSGARVFATTYGYRFLIQSERTPHYLEARIDAFLDRFADALAEMTDTEFEGHKTSMVVRRLEKLTNLDQETYRHWSQISAGYYEFDAVQGDAELIKTLTKADMLEVWGRHMSPSSPTRAKVSVHLLALGKLVEDEKISELVRALGLDGAEALGLRAMLQLSETRHDLADLREYLMYEMGLSPDQAASVLKFVRDNGQGQGQEEEKQQQQQEEEKPAGQLNGDEGGAKANGVNGTKHAKGEEWRAEGAEGGQEKRQGGGGKGAPPPPPTKPVMITNVRKFKASLVATAAATPVKSMVEYEETEPKL